MKEGRKPEYPEKTPGDELAKHFWLLLLLSLAGQTAFIIYLY